MAFGRIPGNVVADAGYGSEENYTYLQAQGVNAYVKHNEFFREIKNPKWRNDPFRPANWDHDEASDAYICPEGRRLEFQGSGARKRAGIRRRVPQVPLRRMRGLPQPQEVHEER